MNNEATITKPTVVDETTERTRTGCCYRPNVDILERGDELMVIADVPGAKNDSIDIHFEEGVLEIRAAVEPRHGNGFLRQEYGVGDYYRTFQVSEAIDASKISAEYSDGVLTLHLPKSEAAKPRKINVQASA